MVRVTSRLLVLLPLVAGHEGLDLGGPDMGGEGDGPPVAGS